MKKFFVFFYLFVCVFLKLNVYSYDFNIPNPTTEFYVNDFANIIKKETKEKILKMSEKIAENNDGVQIVVVTVKTMDGVNCSEFATEMFRRYKIGKKDKGILFLVSSKDKKVRIEVGYHLENFFNDAKIGAILDNYVMPHFKNGNFDKGIFEGYKAIASNFIVIDKNFDSKESEYYNYFGILPFFFIVMMILIFFGGRGGPGSFIGGFLFGNFMNSDFGFKNSNNERNGGFGGSSGGGGSERDF
ncbi:MAG: TPM domain-containing protein [Clostridiales bacterium]|nr:TPM domain-containing protein [Clostridiales bacterium]